jgi:hypothetical protein
MTAWLTRLPCGPAENGYTPLVIIQHAASAANAGYASQPSTTYQA